MSLDRSADAGTFAEMLRDFVTAGQWGPYLREGNPAFRNAVKGGILNEAGVRQELVAALSEQMTGYQAAIANLDQEIANLDQEIANLKSDLAALEGASGIQEGETVVIRRAQ